MSFSRSQNSSGGTSGIWVSSDSPASSAFGLTSRTTVRTTLATSTVSSSRSSSPGFRLRQIEDLVDDLQQVRAGIEDVVDIGFVGRVVHRAMGAADHQLGEADDGVERRAQLMADIGEELRLGAIGRFGAFLGDTQRVIGGAPLDFEIVALEARSSTARSSSGSQLLSK